MNSAEYRAAIDALPFGKRLPGAVYLLDPGDDARVPSLLRITVAELRKRLEIGTCVILTTNVIEKALGLQLDAGEQKVEGAHLRKNSLQARSS